VSAGKTSSLSRLVSFMPFSFFLYYGFTVSMFWRREKIIIMHMTENIAQKAMQEIANTNFRFYITYLNYYLDGPLFFSEALCYDFLLLGL